MTSPDTLHAPLVAAFPPAPITRSIIDASDARWTGYEERDDLGLLERSSWLELGPDLLERHPRLLVHAGTALFRAVVPAYLRYLLAFAEGDFDRGYGTMLPYSVATQLARPTSSFAGELFDERVGPMTADQRRVVRDVLAAVAGQPQLRAALRDALSHALRSW